ncbi:MAG: inositol monophosphatase [Deltaproteobacteria bacterium]|nr:inositol monophosphatase [Deltaproteobacteria bacterium]
MLKTAIEAAQGAGRIIAGRYPGGRDITLKGLRDLVTDADMAAESVIVELIQTRFPDHAILSEEAGGEAIGSGFTWVVDPLDGTTNYAHHHPLFAVSIGVLEGKKPLIGVIHDPLRDQTFVAHRGAGARLNNVPIHVSRIKRFEEAMVGLDWGHENEVRERMLRYLGRVLPRCGTVRASGSAALGLAYVAAGWLDAYFHPGLKPWDAAAGILLVKEAGGRCTTMKGAPYQVQLPDCLATNRSLHDELFAAMQAG